MAFLHVVHVPSRRSIGSVPIDDSLRNAVDDVIQDMSARSLRVLALAQTTDLGALAGCTRRIDETLSYYHWIN